MKTYYTVYKITNTINDEYYIGKHQTQNLEDGYMGSGRLLQKQFQEYGMQWFKKEILHVFDTEEEMNQMEAELVDIDDPKSLNLCPGGKGGWGYINTNRDFKEHNQKLADARDYSKTNWNKTPEQRQRLSESLKRAWAEDPTRFHIPNTTGFKHSEETKAKMSVAGSGKNNSQFGSFWITNGTENKKCRGEIPEGWYKGRI